MTTSSATAQALRRSAATAPDREATSRRRPLSGDQAALARVLEPAPPRPRGAVTGPKLAGGAGGAATTQSSWLCVGPTPDAW